MESKHSISSGIKIFFWALAITLLFAGAGISKTWIVDAAGGPGVDFTDIPPAIAAAEAGDLIIVRTGLYSAFTLDKGLTMTADTGANPQVPTGTPIIEKIAQNKSATLAGFNMDHLLIQSCQGAVLVDECICIALEASALQVLNCKQVALYRGKFEGNDEYGQKGAEIVSSTVIASLCHFEGSRGWDGYYSSGGPGREALRMEDSTVYLQASHAYGGNGGDAWWDDWKIFNGGDGAPAVWLMESYLEMFGTAQHQIHGGYGGEPSNDFAYWGDDAFAVEAMFSTVYYSGYTIETHSLWTTPPDIFGTMFSTVEEIIPAVPVITCTGPAQLGTYIDLKLHGSAGWSYILFASAGAEVSVLPSMYTALLLERLILLPIVSGIFPGSEVSFYIPIPTTIEWQGYAVHLQAYVKTDTGKPYLSTSAGFVLR
ncbi:MAG: hypothetical protein ACYTG7_18050 [Planctomycetota bacterium]|jgi:hypothetical protein